MQGAELIRGTRIERGPAALGGNTLVSPPHCGLGGTRWGCWGQVRLGGDKPQFGESSRLDWGLWQGQDVSPMGAVAVIRGCGSCTQAGRSC